VTFEGTLIDYDKASEIVAVRIKGGVVSKFPLNKLNESDQEYILKNAEVIAAGQNLRCEFEVRIRGVEKGFRDNEPGRHAQDRQTGWV